MDRYSFYKSIHLVVDSTFDRLQHVHSSICLVQHSPAIITSECVRQNPTIPTYPSPIKVHIVIIFSTSNTRLFPCPFHIHFTGCFLSYFCVRDTNALCRNVKDIIVRHEFLDVSGLGISFWSWFVFGQWEKACRFGAGLECIIRVVACLFVIVNAWCCVYGACY